MNIFTCARKKASRILAAASAVLVSALLVSCDSFVYDSEGDCSVTYRIKFRYDKNLKWADAFANEVKSVHLYAYGPDGRLVWEKSEKGDHLAQPGYSMTLDLPAGDYHLVAWCGLDNDPGDKVSGESFAIDMPHSIGQPVENLMCRLNAKSDEKHPSYSDERLYSLFHGSLDVSLPANIDGGEYEYTIPLTKDTNHIRIILQHLSGEDTDVDDFTFTIEDDNGLMAHDNTLVHWKDILYRTWNTQSGVAGVGKEDIPDASRSLIYVNGAIADLTVGRLMESHRRDMMLRIVTKEGKEVATVPVIDYALLAKDYYEEAYGHQMSDQEFLDREDEYVMTFFLDRDNKWISSSVLIHSWRVVFDDYEL